MYVFTHASVHFEGQVKRNSRDPEWSQFNEHRSQNKVQKEIPCPQADEENVLSPIGNEMELHVPLSCWVNKMCCSSYQRPGKTQDYQNDPDLINVNAINPPECGGHHRKRINKVIFK